jgi:hypothetical protein
VRQKSRGNEIVWHRLTLGIDIKTQEHNSYHMIERVVSVLDDNVAG